MQVMTTDVRLASPDQSIQSAAAEMAAGDLGSLPVGEDDRLIGMVTDRDIAVRGVALGLGPETLVRDVMTEGIRYCFEDDDVAHVAQNMAELGVRRLPVIDRDKRIVGIVCLSNIADAGNPRATRSLLEAVAAPH